MTQTGYVLPAWQPKLVAVEYDAHGTSHGRPFDHPWADDGPYWINRRAKHELFEPRVLEEPDGDSSYGDGWVRVMVFWVTNRSRDTSQGWDFDRLGPRLTQGVAARVRD
jgi:hypothetical protein